MIVATRISVFAAVFWLLAPRVMRIIDGRLVRARLRDSPAPDPSAERAARPSRPRSEPDVAECLADLSRALRGGTVPRDAVATFLEHAWPDHRLRLDESLDLPHALSTCARSAPPPIRQVLALVSAACTGGGVSPDGIDHAASVVRAHSRFRDEARTAAAQARLSVQFLTVLPVAALVLLVMVKGTESVTSGPVAIGSVLIGLVLNRIGARWSRALSARAATVSFDPVPPLVSSFSVALRAGLDPVSACVGWRDINPLGARVAALLGQGRTLAESMLPLAQHSAWGARVADVIVESVSTGLPLAATASRILDQTAHEERREIDARIRQLPVRLTAPVVLCALPSFILLAIVPTVIAAFPRGIPGRTA